jgi:hypothetical protein
MKPLLKPVKPALQVVAITISLDNQVVLELQDGSFLRVRAIPTSPAIESMSNEGYGHATHLPRKPSQQGFSIDVAELPEEGSVVF